MTDTMTTAEPIGIYDPARPDKIQAFIPEADTHTALPESIRVFEVIKLAEQALVAMGASATVRSAWRYIASRTAKADWYATDSGPLCWIRQTDLARAIGVGERQCHNIERQLARFGLIARDVPANGFRGHRRRDGLGRSSKANSGSSPRRSGLSLEPAIRNFQAIAMFVERANKAEAERSDRVFEARKTERRLRDLITRVPESVDRETFDASFGRIVAECRPRQPRSAPVEVTARWQDEMDELEGRVRAVLAQLSAAAQFGSAPPTTAHVGEDGRSPNSPEPGNTGMAPTRAASPSSYSSSNSSPSPSSTLSSSPTPSPSQSRCTAMPDGESGVSPSSLAGLPPACAAATATAQGGAACPSAAKEGSYMSSGTALQRPGTGVAAIANADRDMEAKPSPNISAPSRCNPAIPGTPTTTRGSGENSTRKVRATSSNGAKGESASITPLGESGTRAASVQETDRITHEPENRRHPTAQTPVPMPVRDGNWVGGRTRSSHSDEPDHVQNADSGGYSPSCLPIEPELGSESPLAGRPRSPGGIEETALKRGASTSFEELDSSGTSRRPDGPLQVATQNGADAPSPRNTLKGKDAPDIADRRRDGSATVDAVAPDPGPTTRSNGNVGTGEPRDPREAARPSPAVTVGARRPKADQTVASRGNDPAASGYAPTASRHPELGAPKSRLDGAEHQARSAQQPQEISGAPEIGFRCHIQPESKTMVACSKRQPSQEREMGAEGHKVPLLRSAILPFLTTEILLSLASDAAAIHVEGLPWAEAARQIRHDLGINAAAWDEATRSMTEPVAFIALLVIDRNRFHPDAPIRNPGGALRAFARRARVGRLDLARSVFGILDRQRKGRQPKS